MMRSGKILQVSLFSFLCFATLACGGDPAPPAEASAPADPAATAADGARTLPLPSSGENPHTAAHGRLRWDVPDAWVEVTPSSNMRLAQYRVPGSAGDGECVVFYFGPGQGGDPLANAQRWAGQFMQPDGGNSLELMKMEQIEGGALGLRLVEVTGTYDGGMTMGMSAPTPMPDWMLLGGIADGPDAPWFFKFTGPQATLEENREAFVGLLRSIRQEI